MRGFGRFLAGGLMLAGAAVAGTTTIDYITPFTSSNGLSVNNASQAGQTITVPTGVYQLTGFSLVFYDASGSALTGEVQKWNTNTSAWDAPVFTSSPLAAPGTSQVFGSYYAWTFNSAVAVNAGDLLLLSLNGAGFSGNLGWFGYPGNVYSGGNILVNQGTGLGSIFNVGEDMAFSATFANTPEPGTIGMILGGVGLIGLAKMRFNRGKS
ncbi:MAG: PEP-CTERM sorting domain-containing protein [Acidobacteria bacterium]|nr:PEP-CTERM sorting domain-containing protein [Acidobacteriota bacterium]